MKFVFWLTGVCAIIAACKFVILVFKKVTSKENMNEMLDRANYGLQDAANRAASWYDKNKERRKKQKVEKENERMREKMKKNRPMVEIH